MSGSDPVSGPDKRRTLWLVLALNVAIALGFYATGYIADSSALIANGLDNTSDAVVYALSLVALTRSDGWKRGAARFSGAMLLVFAVGVVADAYRRYSAGSDPGGATMIVMACLAGAVNLGCLRLLQKLESKDVNLRAATTFSVNDFASNGGIIIAGVLVWLTGSNLPDLLVGMLVAGIAFYGAVQILLDAHREAEGTE